ncbi:helix-turn-helix transcriptional regulator [Streptomyces sp. NPDC086777]|uniref:helix-turn-helix transcriptional regulator n=1 Tax=Streptomyces sp. NPDC086777 TaxID=3154866 RepID=UPI00344C38F2
MGLDLGEDGLDLPAFGIERGQLPGRIASGVQQSGDQSIAIGCILTDLALEPVGQDPDLRELPALAGIGEARLAQVVREATGLSPWRHLIALRITEAKRLLATTALSVTEIGYRCGFATPSHFAASFRHATGTSPTRRRATSV